jgi:hypothetical protein
MARGDHIYVSRGLYTHHGIDAGDDTAIHFTGEPGSKRNAVIARSSMGDFLQGAECKVRPYGKRDDVGTTMARANLNLGRRPITQSPTIASTSLHGAAQGAG